MDEQPSVLYICHHGTKGQKWGLRLYQNKDGSLTALGRIRYGKDGPKQQTGNKDSAKKSTVKSSSDADAAPKKKSIAEMSDDELRGEINRLNLEKQYKQLLNEVSPKKERRVRKLISEVAETSAKNIGTQATTYAMGAAVNKICRKVFNIDYDIVNPKKGQKDKP